MSLVEKAKKKAVEAEKKKKAEEDAEAKSAAYLKTSLAKITRQVLSGLREFHGVKTKQGTLRLVRKQKKPFNKTVAILRLIRPKGQESVDLLHVDSAIESGTRDYSDDCRDIPYTESTCSFYVKETNTRNDPYDYGPRYANPAVRGVGLTDHFYESVHNWNDDDLQKKLEKVAEWLAPIF